MKTIPVAGAWITEKELSYVADAAANAWQDRANEYHDRLEQAFRDYLGVRYAVALPSATSAIHLALIALGVGPGDEVIVPDVTWIATAAPVKYLGATPVFADIDPATWCLDPASFEAAITPRTKVVIPVDLYGGMADYQAIRAIAQAKGVHVLEDAAEAIGSRYQDRPAGTLGDLGIFSFHGSKTMTTGEGGLLVTDDEALFRRVQIQRDHGRVPGDKLLFNREVGQKYKMSSLQAAMGLGQIERIDALVEKKRAIFAHYVDRLGKLPGVSWNAEPTGVLNSYWMVTAVLDPSLGWEKEALIKAFAARGISTRPMFYPLSGLPAFEGEPGVAQARARNQVAHRLSPYGINLPSGLMLTEEELDQVCRAFEEILAQGQGAVGPAGIASVS